MGKKAIKRETVSLRLDTYLIDQARLQNIDINSLIEETLKKFLKTKKCPTCGLTVTQE